MFRKHMHCIPAPSKSGREKKDEEEEEERVVFIDHQMI